MRKAAIVAAFIGLATLATGAQAAPPKPGTIIPNGTYHCEAGSSRMMLTLGDMQISSIHYTFKAPTGAATSGTYALAPDGYRWSGDIGEIKNDMIVESGPDATPGDFWSSYRARPTSLPTMTAAVGSDPQGLRSGRKAGFPALTRRRPCVYSALSAAGLSARRAVSCFAASRASIMSPTNTCG